MNMIQAKYVRANLHVRKKPGNAMLANMVAREEEWGIAAVDR